jgi:hypothetical protein
MLFGMVERGMSGEVVGDKGKLRMVNGPTNDQDGHNNDAMWAVVLTKELWKKKIWSVSFVTLFQHELTIYLGMTQNLFPLFLKDASTP